MVKREVDACMESAGTSPAANGSPGLSLDRISPKSERTFFSPSPNSCYQEYIRNTSESEFTYIVTN